MTTEVVVTTKRPRVVAELVESIGGVISGDDSSDPHDLHECFWSAFAASLATSVHHAFIVKSKLGTDELGQSWPDLDPKTKAYSRPEGRKGLPLYKGKPTKWGNKYRPTLTKEQDAQWRAVFVGRLKFFRTQMSEGEASRKAAESAWAYVKSRLGATTILAYAKGKALLLLQRSGALEKALRPGSTVADRYTPPANQVARIGQTGLTWGVKLPYANRVSKKRPLWPDHIDPWIDRAVEAGITATIEKLKKVL